MIRFCERYCQGVIEGERKGLLSALTRSFLRVASVGYRVASTGHRLVYTQGLVSRYVAPVPMVISVGNIVAGGTGKTPFTILLAESLKERVRLGILTRGYRGEASKQKSPTRLVGIESASVQSVGDEPAVMARRLQDVPLYVGRDRVQASIMAAKDGCEVLLLDDGLQHRKLQRDLDLVLMDARDPFGQGHYLPRGYLRQSPKTLAAAGYIVGNHLRTTDEYIAFERRVRSFTQAPIIGVAPAVSSIEDVFGEPKTQLFGAKVALMSGIAKPQHFKTLVEELGAHVVLEKKTADHTIPREKEIRRFSEKAAKAGAELLLITEKDRVKLQGELTLALPVASVQIRLKKTFGEEHFTRLIESIEAQTR